MSDGVTVLGWHFLYPDNKLRDGRDSPPDGVTLQQDGSIIPCENGLHASERVIDALGYHPELAGSPLCRVELSGTIVPHENDKLAASERRILWRLDGETTDRVLREFARWCALQVIDLWDAPPVVRQWLETGDESLRAAARDAAWAAARAAAWAAAWDAAWDAARGAAWAAAWDAADAAAGHVAWNAARDAAWNAARAEQNAYLEHLVNEAHEAQGDSISFVVATNEDEIPVPEKGAGA